MQMKVKNILGTIVAVSVSFAFTLLLIASAILSIRFVIGLFSADTSPETVQASETVDVQALEEKPAEQRRKTIEEFVPYQELVDAVNIYRLDAGLQPLIVDEQLNITAEAKCEDLLEKNYWSHVNPDGEDYTDIAEDYGVTYTFMGENLTRSYYSPDAVAKSWYDSPTHRENMLHPRFEYVGYGLCENGYEGIHVNKATIVQHLIDKD